MGGITVGPAEDYLYSLLPARDEVLAEMETEAAKRKIPIVGPAVGRILHQLALMIDARKIFEMGSAIGYSTIWWARALGTNGRVIYTDGDPKMPTKPAAISTAPESLTASPSKPATPWNSSPKRKISSISYLTMSIRKTIRACSVL